VGDDRFAAFLLRMIQIQPIYETRGRQNLSNSAALQAYEIMKVTTDELARARRDRTLSASERRAQMEEIRKAPTGVCGGPWVRGRSRIISKQDAARGLSLR